MKIKRPTEPRLFFSKGEKKTIVEAIKKAEKQTSGEIRVHLERKKALDMMDHARMIFEKIGMTKTALKNGVLIYLNTKTREFTVLGDLGIHQKVGSDFWAEAVFIMEKHFSEDRFADGIGEAIIKIGEKLAVFFPRQITDHNELPDELSH